MRGLVELDALGAQVRCARGAGDERRDDAEDATPETAMPSRFSWSTLARQGGPRSRLRCPVPSPAVCTIPRLLLETDPGRRKHVQRRDGELGDGDRQSVTHEPRERHFGIHIWHSIRYDWAAKLLTGMLGREIRAAPAGRPEASAVRCRAPVEQEGPT